MKQNIGSFVGLARGFLIDAEKKHVVNEHQKKMMYLFNRINHKMMTMKLVLLLMTTGKKRSADSDI